MVAAKDASLAFIVMMAAFSIPGKVLVAEQTRRIAIADGLVIIPKWVAQHTS
jgi:hypothetical protein